MKHFLTFSLFCSCSSSRFIFYKSQRETKSQITNWSERFSVFKAESFNVAAELKALARRGQQRFIKSVWISGRLETWNMLICVEDVTDFIFIFIFGWTFPLNQQWRGTVFSDRRLANSLFSRITMSFLMESRWATICCRAISCQQNRLHHVTEYIYFTPGSCSTTQTFYRHVVLTGQQHYKHDDLIEYDALVWIKPADRIWRSLTKVNLA